MPSVASEVVVPSNGLSRARRGPEASRARRRRRRLSNNKRVSATAAVMLSSAACYGCWCATTLAALGSLDSRCRALTTAGVVGGGRRQRQRLRSQIGGGAFSNVAAAPAAPHSYEIGARRDDAKPSELCMFGGRSNGYSATRLRHGEITGVPSQPTFSRKGLRRREMLPRIVQKLSGKLSALVRRRRQIIDDDTLPHGGGDGATVAYPSLCAARNQIIIAGRASSASARRLRLARVQSLANSPHVPPFAPPTSSQMRRQSNTALHMVLTTPDTIIEQASTKRLLDELLDESVRTQSRQPIMIQFNPKRGFLWRQWRGTVFSETWKSGLLNMALAAVVVFLYDFFPSLKGLLTGFSTLWGQLLSVTTFTLTFFLNQSYGLWRKCYEYSRRLQGRLNDLGMTLAAHATRTRPSSPDVPSTYTEQSRQALLLVSRYVRLFNLLMYASFTRSHRPILTPRGMKRLVDRGILTPIEHRILTEAEVPPTQRHNAVLIWLMRILTEGMQLGVFEGGSGFEQQFMEKCHVIRAQYGGIGDELQGRIPMAYAHIVQVLLDVVLWMYPFMALSSGMAWYIGILGTGLLTMFYQGLFDLAKQFLDPYDNENYGKGDDPMIVDTLIAETNAGSVRWINSFHMQPWSRKLLDDGELYDSLLPLRGYSVEELEEKEAQEEMERMEKELARQEKKMREEELSRQNAEELLRGYVKSSNRSSSVVGEKFNGTAFLTPEGEMLMNGDTQGSGGLNVQKKFLEVSGGEVVETASLLPSKMMGSLKVEEEDTKEENTHLLGANNTSVEMVPNKVLSLADGTLVTLGDDALTINTTEPAVDMNATLPEINQNTSNILPNKVLTLADGTLVTMNNTGTTFDSNTTEFGGDEVTTTVEMAEKVLAKVDETSITESRANYTYADTPAQTITTSSYEEGGEILTTPAVRAVTNEVAWDKLGTVPNFQESIAEMEAFGQKETSSLQTVGAIVPSFDTQKYLGSLGNEDDIGYMEEDPMNFDPMAFEWFDEVGEDGKEYRLSEMLADEEWPEEEEYLELMASQSSEAKNKTMTYEEFAQKATEIIEQAENELAETTAILAVSPGSEAGLETGSRDESSSISSATVQKQPNAITEPAVPLYDQTKLDGISQLWGAPPEVLRDYRKSLENDEDDNEALINEGVGFSGVYALWGEGNDDGPASDYEDESAPSSVSVDGISQLWNENISPYKIEQGGSLGNYLAYGDDGDDAFDTMNDKKAFAGIDWWDEVAEDGSYKSLSQMLADEEYEELNEEDDEPPMTFERFAEETEKLIEQAEDERKETEAILNASPNAEFLESDEEDVDELEVERAVEKSDEFKELIKSLDGGVIPSSLSVKVANMMSESEEKPEETISDEEIGLLEMDEEEQRSAPPPDAGDEVEEDINIEEDGNE